MSTKRKAVMVYMDESDLAALADARRRLGATTNSGAIRAALRVLANGTILGKGVVIGAALTEVCFLKDDKDG